MLGTCICEGAWNEWNVSAFTLDCHVQGCVDLRGGDQPEAGNQGLQLVCNGYGNPGVFSCPECFFEYEVPSEAAVRILPVFKHSLAEPKLCHRGLNPPSLEFSHQVFSNHVGPFSHHFRSIKENIQVREGDTNGVVWCCCLLAARLKGLSKERGVGSWEGLLLQRALAVLCFSHV